MTNKQPEALQRALDEHKHACRPLYEISLLTDQDRARIAEKVKGRGRHPGVGSVRAGNRTA